MLLLTGLIWGVAFVAQSEGMNYVGAFTFNCCRFMIGGVMLIPCIFFLRSIGAGENGHVSRGQRQQQRHMAVIGGICCGLVICVCQHPAADGDCSDNRRKSRIYYSSLHCHCSGAGAVFGKKHRSEYLAQCGNCGCGDVSFMYYGRLFHWTGRFSGIFMCYGFSVLFW